MTADPAILRRSRGCPFARGGRVQGRFRANGYSLFARRSGEPLARLRLTGNGDEVVLLYPSHRGGWGHSATSAQAPCRSTRRSNASATIHISWNCARHSGEPPQRIDAKSEGLPWKLQVTAQPTLKRKTLSYQCAMKSV